MKNPVGAPEGKRAGMIDDTANRRPSLRSSLLPGERKVAGAFVYDPSAVLGEGASGQAFRGRDIRTNTPIALKIFVVESMRLEVQLARRLQQQQRSGRAALSPRPPSPKAHPPPAALVRTPLSPSSAFPSGTGDIVPDEVSILYLLQRARCVNIVRMHAAFYHDPLHHRQRRRDEDVAYADPSTIGASPLAATAIDHPVKATQAGCGDGAMTDAAHTPNMSPNPYEGRGHSSGLRASATASTPLQLPAPSVQRPGGDALTEAAPVTSACDPTNEDKVPVAHTRPPVTTATFVVVTDYCAGGNLHTFVRQRGPQSVWLVRAWAYQMLNALTVLHQAGVLHRDIKPENVLLTPAHTPQTVAPVRVTSGLTAHRTSSSPTSSTLPASTACLRGDQVATTPPQCPPVVGVTAPSSAGLVTIEEAALCLWTVKLADFGTAMRIRTRDCADAHLWMCDDHDREGHSGSLLYLAPERLAKEAYHESADLYAVGVVLLEMLHGGPLLWVTSAIASSTTQLGMSRCGSANLDEAASIHGAMTAALADVGARWREMVQATAPAAPADRALTMQYADLALALLAKMITADPAHRITAWEAVEHPFFASPCAQSTADTSACEVSHSASAPPDPPGQSAAFSADASRQPVPPLPPLTLRAPLHTQAERPLPGDTPEPTHGRSPSPHCDVAAERSPLSLCPVESLPASSALRPQRAPPGFGEGSGTFSPANDPGHSPSSPPALALPAPALSITGLTTSLRSATPPVQIPNLTRAVTSEVPEVVAAGAKTVSAYHEQEVKRKALTAVLAARVYVSTLLTHGMSLALDVNQADGEGEGHRGDDRKVNRRNSTMTSVAAVLTYAEALLRYGRSALADDEGEAPTSISSAQRSNSPEGTPLRSHHHHHHLRNRVHHANLETWLADAASFIARQRRAHHLPVTDAVTLDRLAVREILVSLVARGAAHAAKAEVAQDGCSDMLDAASPPIERTLYLRCLAVARVLLQVAVLRSDDLDVSGEPPAEPLHLLPVPLVDLFDEHDTQRARLSRLTHAVVQHLAQRL